MTPEERKDCYEHVMNTIGLFSQENGTCEMLWYYAYSKKYLSFDDLNIESTPLMFPEFWEQKPTQEVRYAFGFWWPRNKAGLDQRCAALLRSIELINSKQ